MSTHFLTLELDWMAPSELQQSILQALQQYGEPLRWAITAVDRDRGKVWVEAVVTRDIDFLIPGVAVTTA